MEGFKATDRVADHYDTNLEFAAVLNRVIPGFEYPNWSYRTIAQALGSLEIRDRQELENALNGWRLEEKTLTPRQERFVSEHSGEQRSDRVREAIASVGSDALALMRANDERGARDLMRDAGLSAESINLFVLGWGNENIGNALDERPAICCIVNALAHKTYVGRIVRVTDNVIWQEVELGQIVEHERDNLGDIPEAMEEPFYGVAEAGEISKPWDNSWCISYAGNGTAVVKTAALLLLDGNSIKPNPFRGRVVSETERRFVQENAGNVYTGHLKEMTGDLEIGKTYEITYRGAMGQQVAEVKACRADVLNIGTDIYKRLHMVVSPRDITDCVDGLRTNASFSGKILEVDQERGLVVQSLGRQQATVHRLGDFEQAPVAGKNMDIKYRDGKVALGTELGTELGQAQGVGR